MINEDDPAQQPRSLLSFQNVRTVLSLAFIDSKIPKSTLMKIEIKEVLETVNNEIELLVFRNGGNFLCAISRILQKKCALLMQELRDFYDNFKNELFRKKVQILQLIEKTTVHLLEQLFLMLTPAYLSISIENLRNVIISSASTASIEELSNQSIQNPRNIASKDKITMPAIITPFRAKQPELVGSSNLLINDKFSEEVSLSSGIGNATKAKSSMMKSIDQHGVVQEIIQEEEPLPEINIMDADQEQESNVSMTSNLPPINDSRIGDIAGAMRNEEALSFKARIERTKNQSEKKQRQKNFFDDEIELKGESVAQNLMQDFAAINIEQEEEATKDSINAEKDETISYPNRIPENFMKKSLLDKIAKNLSKVSLAEDTNEEQLKLAHSDRKKMPFKFSLQEDLPIEEQIIIPQDENQENLDNNNFDNNQPAIEDENRPEFLENEPEALEMRIDSESKGRGLSKRKNINEKEDAINQKLLKVIKEMSEERKINDFENLHERTKATYTRAQLFLEMLHLMRQDLVILNQSSSFGKISFGLI